MIGHTTTSVLLAVMSQDRATVRSVAAVVGRSINATPGHLKRLRDEGLVTWEDGKKGTLRAAVGVVNCFEQGFEHGNLGALAQDASDPRTAVTAGGLDDTPRRCRRG